VFGSEWSLITTSIWLPNIVLFATVLASVVIGLRRVRVTYHIYAVALAILSFSASWIISGQRYTSIIFPTYISLAATVGRKPAWDKGITATWAAFYALYAAAAVLRQQIW